MIALASGHLTPVIGPDGSSEYVVTSAIKALVAQQFKSAGHRVKCVPVMMPNRERIQLVQSAEADVYVSIECTTDTRHVWSGIDGAKFEAPNRSVAIARNLSMMFSELVPVRLINGDGVKVRDDSFLSKRMKCHMVKISCGYLSNRSDVEVMKSNDGRKLIASAIVAGVSPWAS